jgi:hypothetical protein
MQTPFRFTLYKYTRNFGWLQNTYYHTQLHDIRFSGVTVGPTSKFRASPITVEVSKYGVGADHISRKFVELSRSLNEEYTQNKLFS